MDLQWIYFIDRIAVKQLRTTMLGISGKHMFFTKTNPVTCSLAASYLFRHHTDLMWWVFYDPLHSALVSLYRGPLANLWHPIQQATKELIRAPLGGSLRKVLIWYFQGIPEPQQCIHTALVHAWLGPLLQTFIVCGARQRLRTSEGEPTRRLSCCGSQKPDANGILMGLKHCTYWKEGPVI